MRSLLFLGLPLLIPFAAQAAESLGVDLVQVQQASHLLTTLGPGPGTSSALPAWTRQLPVSAARDDRELQWQLHSYLIAARHLYEQGRAIEGSAIVGGPQFEQAFRRGSDRLQATREVMAAMIVQLDARLGAVALPEEAIPFESPDLARWLENLRGFGVRAEGLAAQRVALRLRQSR